MNIMESTSSEKSVIENSTICENGESVKKSEIKLVGLFKSNSWKATLALVLVCKYKMNFHFVYDELIFNY